MPIKNEVRIGLGAPAWQQLQNIATARGQSVQVVARALLEQALSAQAPALTGQPDAERRLLECVQKIALGHRMRDDWKEDITLTVFEELLEVAGPLYRAAVTAENANRLHREIGRMIRKTLGAVTRTIDGRLRYAAVPRGSTVPIKTYTLLFRPEI